MEYQDANGNLIKDELKKNGSNEPVLDVNDYIKTRIDYIVKKQKFYINLIRSGLFNVCS